MNRISLTLTILITFLPGGWLKKYESSFPFKPELPVVSHPRLLLTREHQQRITTSIKEDSLAALFHKLILRKAIRYASENSSAIEKTGKRLLQSVHQLSKRIITLSYAWRFTQQDQFLTAAWNDLEMLCSLTDWNPEHFLDVAEITFAVSIGYDWLFDGLTVEQKERLQSSIIEKGIEPSLDPKFNSWLEKSNNWNQVCNAGMVTGALTAYEMNPDLARKILLRSLESNYKALETYQPDGAYAEGYGYWSYGTHFQVILISILDTAIKNHLSLSIPPGFWKTPHYLRQLSGTSGASFNYSDSDATARINPSMFWFASMKKDASLLWSEQQFLAEPSKISSRDLVFLMLWADFNQLTKITAPEERSWHGGGQNPVMIMRSGWQANDFYVGMKGGSPSVNHGHMDIGSFVLDAFGERWVMDPGREDYHQMESAGLNIWSYKQTSDRWKISKHKTESHSTITLNNQNQQVLGKADFEFFQDDSSIQQGILNMTSVYEPALVKLKRTGQLERKNVIIQDDMENGPQESAISWRVITDAEINIREEGQITLKKNEKTLLLQANCVPPCTASEEKLKKTFEFESIPEDVRVLKLDLVLKPGQTGLIRVKFSGQKEYPVSIR